MKKDKLSFQYKIINTILIILYIGITYTGWYGVISIMYTFGFDKAMSFIDPIYEILLVIGVVILIKKPKYFLFISLLVGCYPFFSSFSTSLDSFSLSWYGLLQGNYIFSINNFCIYMIPIVSAIGLIIWYSDRNKQVNKK